MSNEVYLPDTSVHNYKPKFDCRHLIKICDLTIKAPYDLSNLEKEIKNRFENQQVSVWEPLFLCSPRGRMMVKWRGDFQTTKIQCYSEGDEMFATIGVMST